MTAARHERVVRIQHLRFEPKRIRGEVWNPSSRQVESLRIVYVPGDDLPGERFYFCDLDMEISPGDSRRFECCMPAGETPICEGDLRVLSVVTRAAPSGREGSLAQGA